MKEDDSCGKIELVIHAVEDCEIASILWKNLVSYIYMRNFFMLVVIKIKL